MTTKPNNRNLTGATIRGGYWLASGAVGRQALQFLVLLVLARLLTPHDFGVVGAAMVIVGAASMFSQLGVGPAIVQRPRLTQSHIRAAFWTSVGLGAVVTAIVWWAAVPAAAFFRMDELVGIVRALSALFLIRGVFVVAESLLQRELRFREIAEIELISHAVGYGAVGVASAFAGFGAWALVHANIGLSITRAILFWIKRRHSIVPAFRFRDAGELGKFGVGHTLARVGNYAALQGDNIIVGRLFGAEPLGIYGRAYQFHMMPVTIVGRVLDRLLFPSFSSIQDDPRRLGLGYTRSVAGVALVIMPISVLMVVLAPELVAVTLGPQWTAVIQPLQVLSLGLVFRTSYKVSDSVALATGAVYDRAWRQVLYAAAVVVGSLIGAVWGPVGVATGVLGAIVLNYVLMAHLACVKSSVTLRSFIAAQAPGLFTAIGAAAVAIPTGFIARHLVASPIVTIISTSLITSVAVRFGAWMHGKKVFVGEHGEWLFQKLQQHSPVVIRPLFTV